MAITHFTTSESAKLNMTKDQLFTIREVYENAADNVAKKANNLPTTGSYPYQQQAMNGLVNDLKQEVTQVNNQIQNNITSGIKEVTQAVVTDNEKLLGKMGINIEGAYAYVPDEAVKQIISGNVYNNSWTLSAAIWGTNQKQLFDIDKIVATGLAENKDIFNIAKDLEMYVSPTAKKPWDWGKVYPGTNRVIDYNAQRLARTMSNHAYQKAFQMTTEKNPFVTAYKWINAHGACPRCTDLATKDDFGLGAGVFPKDAIPLDHPNGNCTIGAVTVSDQEMIDRLASWVNGNEDLELDEFAKSMGFFNIDKVKDAVNPSKFTDLKSFQQVYGNSKYKSINGWMNQMSKEDKIFVKQLKKQSGMKWDDFYKTYFYKGKNAVKSSDELIEITNKISTLKKESLTGVWKNEVTIADYPSLKASGSVDSKIAWLEENIAKYPTSYKALMWQDNLDELYEFIDNGEEYIKLLDELKNAQGISKVVTAQTDKTIAKGFASDLYSDEAKATAKHFTNAMEADKYHRAYLDSMWDKGTDWEKYSVWEYTQNSNPINKSLSGYHDSWNRSSFLGLGKTDLGHEDMWREFDTIAFEKKYAVNGHKDYKSVVQNLTTIIEKSEMQESVILVRGSDVNGFAGMIEGDLFSFNNAKTILQGDANRLKNALEGQVIRNDAFTSTGIAEGTGFDGKVKYKIYAPQGTKAIYAEPASYYGNTIGAGEEIYKVGQEYYSVGHEAEIILQRGTEFRITKINKDTWGNIEVEMEIVNQPNYFKTGLEHTHNAGATSYKK